MSPLVHRELKSLQNIDLSVLNLVVLITVNRTPESSQQWEAWGCPRRSRFGLNLEISKMKMSRRLKTRGKKIKETQNLLTINSRHLLKTRVGVLGNVEKLRKTQKADDRDYGPVSERDREGGSLRLLNMEAWRPAGCLPLCQAQR